MTNFKDRVQHHLHNGKTPAAPRNGKHNKKRRNRNMSQAMRYARAAARKDVNICRSSNGKFSTVDDAVKYAADLHTRRVRTGDLK